MRAWKLISAVALVMVVTGTTWAVTVPFLPGGFDYLKSRNADSGSTYVVAGLNPGDEFIFTNTALPNGVATPVVGNLNGTSGVTRSVTKTQAPGSIGTEDSWGVVLLYQISNGHLSNPGSNGSIVGFGPGGIAYDNSAGTQGTWLTAMFHGGVDTSVDVIVGTGTNLIPLGQEKESIQNAGLKFELYAVNASAIDPTKDSVNLTDFSIARRTAFNQYTGWTGNTLAAADSVFLADGTSNYFQSTVVVDGLGNVVSNSLDSSTVYFDVNAAGTGAWDSVWGGPTPQLLTPTGTPTDLWFQWTLDSGQRNWNVHSDDVGGAFNSAVPEPVTILGVILGIGSLGGYIRRRFHV